MTGGEAMAGVTSDWTTRSRVIPKGGALLSVGAMLLWLSAALFEHAHDLVVATDADAGALFGIAAIVTSLAGLVSAIAGAIVIIRRGSGGGGSGGGSPS